MVLCHEHVALVLARLVTQQNVDLLLDPVLVVRQISLRVLLVHQARQIGQLVNEVEQLVLNDLIFSYFFF